MVDAYGGSPSCLLEGTDIQLIDGSYKKVEGLEIGDWLKTIDLPGAIDEDYDNWRQSRFEEGFEPTFHSASVKILTLTFHKHIGISIMDWRRLQVNTKCYTNQ